VSQHTTNQSFDELARGLAEGSISRRRALKLFAGSAIAALIPSRALADDDCVRVCHVPFDRHTGQCFFGQRENRCVSRRRLRVHLDEHPCDCRGRCANCLTPPCQPNGDTCMANDDCCSGNCSNGFCCESGRVGFTNGTCAKPCTTGTDCPGCTAFCQSSISGAGFCAASVTRDQCEFDSDCPQGQYCRIGAPGLDRFCVIAC
jgi:hypothetical protein